MEKKINIAIDGFSACGKSTLSKDIARRLAYTHIDSGAMYRAVTLHFIKNHIDLEDNKAIEEALQNILLRFEIVDGQNAMFLNGENVSSEIRSMAVNNLVSPVATIGAVRAKVVEQQKRIGARKGIVMDGRDIGTVVFPDAELKLFIIADLKVRTDRRWAELQNSGFDISKNEISKNLGARDKMDSTRDISPLKKAEDAIEIDNSLISRKEQADMVYDLARQKIAEHSIR